MTEYALGILRGVVYGLTADYVPHTTVGFGKTYPAMPFTGASEMVLSALDVVTSPLDRTPIQHLGGLAGNLVYGAVTE